MPDELVGYIRVSTDKQHASGLGEDAQRAALEAFARSRQRTFIRTFEEVETSTKRDTANRPKLAEAIDLTRLTKGTLVIAKLDRLARNVAFLSALMETGIDFRACDMPDANRLTLHIMAAVAEDESRRISQRTKDALAAYKARGGVLGGTNPRCRNLTDEGRARGARASADEAKRRAMEDTQGILKMISPMRANGVTLSAIADNLNEQGYRTRQGGKWTATGVKRVLDRAQGTRQPSASRTTQVVTTQD